LSWRIHEFEAWLERAKVGFTAEAKALNLTPPRGIMLVGVPGCGKSLAAKAIARNGNSRCSNSTRAGCSISLSGNRKRISAKRSKWPNHCRPSCSGSMKSRRRWRRRRERRCRRGLSRRLFGAFLTWLQEKKQEVFVIATANNLTLLPPELLRKGRFDEIFFVDLPDDGEREAIWEIHLGLRKQDSKQFDLVKIVSASDGFSGSEINRPSSRPCIGTSPKDAAHDRFTDRGIDAHRAAVGDTPGRYRSTQGDGAWPLRECPLSHYASR